MCYPLKIKAVIIIIIIINIIIIIFIIIRMNDFQENMTGQEHVEVGFFGVESSTIMTKIVWLEEGCQRLHSHMAPHRLGCELPPSGWGPDIVPVFIPSCRKYVTIGDLLDNMTEDQCHAASWVNDNRDIIMAQLVWAQKGCELAHP